jgi:hypothetical protein
MTDMPVLETARLQIRPFVIEDLQDVHRILDVELAEADLRTDKMETLAERAEWLQWSVLNYRQLAGLRQPPYGDRAVILKSTSNLIGACGYVPCLNPFEQIPVFFGRSTLPGKCFLPQSLACSMQSPRHTSIMVMQPRWLKRWQIMLSSTGD